MATRSIRDVLVIGGGAAGTTAAETYRAGGGTGSVTIVSDELHPLYSRVLLPHAAKAKIDPERAFLKTEDWYREKAVELMKGRSVVRVDYRDKIATLADGEEIGYGKLVIAIGGKPRPWRVPGGDHARVFRLQTYDDALAVRGRLVPEAGMAIVGSGFIALEFAAIAAAKGLKRTFILNRGPHFWASMLGPETAAALQAALEALGVAVRNHAKVARVEGGAAISGVTLSTGETLPCDCVGLGIGVEPPMEPFGDLRGEQGLLADAALRAKHADVWIAGDCAEFVDERLGGLRHVAGNWTNAVAQGRHVGKALLGEKAPYLQLTNYSTNVIPGAHLIFLGECRNLPGSSAETRLPGPGKLVETRKLNGRTIGAILLNAPELRAEISSEIGS